MKQAVIPLKTGDVMFALGDDGAEGLWSVPRAMAREAADRLERAAVLGLPRNSVMLWAVGVEPTWFEGAPDALNRLAAALRQGADVAESWSAVKQ